jgi:ABC-type bacteriocin/lantibiotic exporter with double-glycine peptidase domain
MVQHGVGVLLAGIQLAGCLALMALYSLKLSGVFLFTLPLYAGLMYFSVKFLRPLFADLEEGQGKYSSHQIDAITGLEADKAAAAETAFRARMLNEFLLLSRKRFRATFSSCLMKAPSNHQPVMTAPFLWSARAW